jgi:hypothetical protein
MALNEQWVIYGGQERQIKKVATLMAVFQWEGRWKEKNNKGRE